MRRLSCLLRIAILSGSVSLSFAQFQNDPLQIWNSELQKETNNIFHFTFEERTRWEERYGVNFGKSVNQQDMLGRLRIGAEFRPAKWLKISAMGQDGRVPFFGTTAPNTLRDTMDLQEGYVQFNPDNNTGFGATFGRQMLNYGETRVIGSPQWAPLARTYDSGRMYYQTAKQKFEVLLVSSVKIRPDGFNVPNLGDRIWGTYNVFSKVWAGASIDAYALRHSQNAIGGFTGAGTLGTNTFGARFYGPLPRSFNYTLEGIGQGGHIGPLQQRAFAWAAGISRRVNALNRPLNLYVEYKTASGTKEGSTNSGTYDQLSPANHDKFGHQDLFGWRNLKTLRSLETWNITKPFALNLMYTNQWLYSATDGLYSSPGAVISISKTGTAGTHIGQELDLFATYTKGAHQFGAGFGHFFKGEFVTNTTAHINPRYFYVFQQYTIK